MRDLCGRFCGICWRECLRNSAGYDTPWDTRFGDDRVYELCGEVRWRLRLVLSYLFGQSGRWRCRERVCVGGQWEHVYEAVCLWVVLAVVATCYIRGTWVRGSAPCKYMQGRCGERRWEQRGLNDVIFHAHPLLLDRAVTILGTSPLSTVFTWLDVQCNVVYALQFRLVVRHPLD